MKKPTAFFCMAVLSAAMSSAASAQEDNLVPMPDVEFRYVEAYHDGLGAVVDFTLTNNSQNLYDITFNGTNGLDGWSKSQAVGGDGVARSCYVRALDGNTSMDMVTRYRLMPGTTAKGRFKINKLDRAITSLNGISIAGLWQANEDNNNHNFRFTVNGLIEVVTPINTTQDGVYCTLPELAVTFDKVERRPNHIAFFFTLKNIGQTPLKFQPNFGYVKDINGKDDYSFGIVYDNRELGGYETVVLEPGKTASGIFGVMDVPVSVNAMERIIWILEKPEYLIQLNNPTIPAK